MLDWIALLCLLGAVCLLVWLSVIDLKVRLLPNEIVLAFATLGLIFHLTTLAGFTPVTDILIGGVSGFGALYLIRTLANYYYKIDALGLGDVKLMGAGGVWLGFDGIMLAMAGGALASLLAGFVYGVYKARKDKTRTDFSQMQMPAGPGFAVGIVLAGIVKFQDFPLLF